MKLTKLNDDGLRIPGTTARLSPSDREWSRLGELLELHYKGGLFTILQVDRARALVRRAYTSNAKDYPLGGTKLLLGTPWARHVIDAGRCFIADTHEQMELAFADHATLFALGCTTALNIPLCQGSDVAWTVNLLRGENVFTLEECDAVKSRIEVWVDELYPQCRESRRI